MPQRPRRRIVRVFAAATSGQTSGEDMLQAKLIALLLTLGLLGGGAFYIKHLRSEVTLQADVISGLRADVAERDQSIAALRDSRDTVNAHLKALIADNNAAVEAEVERRRQATADAAKAREALRIALDAIRIEGEQDDEFKTWLAQPVPGAAWDRLRDAAE